MQWSIPERYLHFDSLVKLPHVVKLTESVFPSTAVVHEQKQTWRVHRFVPLYFLPDRNWCLTVKQGRDSVPVDRWVWSPDRHPVSVSLQLEPLEGRKAESGLTRYRLSFLSAVALITRGSRLWLTARHVLVWLCLCIGNRSVATAPGEDPETCYFLPVCRAPCNDFQKRLGACGMAAHLIAVAPTTQKPPYVKQMIMDSNTCRQFFLKKNYLLSREKLSWPLSLILENPCWMSRMMMIVLRSNRPEKD